MARGSRIAIRRPTAGGAMTTYQTVDVDGLEIFYREAGTPGLPKLLLLHGFPSSSHQYRNLLAALEDRFHMVCVDYPGFGHSAMPDPAQWEYTFDRIADVVHDTLHVIEFTGAMGFYMQDYGGPIGNRLIDRHPEWLQWQVIQNANSYEEGFTAAWDGLRHALWTDRSPQTEAPLVSFFQPDTVRAIYTTGHPDVTRISPDNWHMDLHFLAREHADRVQLDLLYDYRKNAALYETWQASLHERQPRTLIFWGQGDLFFTPAGGEAYLRDLPGAELIRLDSGHFALEDCLEQIASRMVSFYDEVVAPDARPRAIPGVRRRS
jgi:pimeloyl-ACP methyl ester carboxylesterase